MHVLIVFNPTAGSANQALLDAIQEQLQHGGAQVSMYPTKFAGDALQHLNQYQGELDVVVAAGGDGTVNEVVNGLKDRDSSTWRLGIIPAGTTNVLARELGIQKSASFLSKMILNGKEKAVYPGRLNGRRFMLMTGVGYDAWVVDNVDLALKKKVGKLAYVLSMVKQLRHFGKKHYRVLVDNTEYQSNSIIITNGRLYGGSFVISKQSDLSSPTTQVLMLNGKNPFALLLSLLGLPFGMMEKMPGIVSVPAKTVRIELLGEGREPVQADGDSIAELPISVEMESSPLRVLVP